MELENKYDIIITLKGGGIGSQSEAIVGLKINFLLKIKIFILFYFLIRNYKLKKIRNIKRTL